MYISVMKEERSATILGFLLGAGKTPVPILSPEEAKALVEYILRDEARSLGRSKVGPYPSDRPPGNHQEVELQVRAAGAHIRYHTLPKWWRGSDRVERIYASVTILMRGSLSQTEACRYVANLLGSKLGTSKRGRPRGSKNRGHTWQTVRSNFNSFCRRNPFKNEDSAEFVDSTTEKWFQYALALAYWELSGELLLVPSGWRTHTF